MVKHKVSLTYCPNKGGETIIIEIIKHFRRVIMHELRNISINPFFRVPSYYKLYRLILAYLITLKHIFIMIGQRLTRSLKKKYPPNPQGGQGSVRVIIHAKRLPAEAATQAGSDSIGRRI